jgi:hypothetical protein
MNNIIPLQLQQKPAVLLDNVPVNTVKSLVRLFASIIDTDKQRFNITALPRGIAVLDYCYETHAVTIRYKEQVYKVSINNNGPVVEVVS